MGSKIISLFNCFEHYFCEKYCKINLKWKCFSDLSIYCYSNSKQKKKQDMLIYLIQNKYFPYILMILVKK